MNTPLVVAAPETGHAAARMAFARAATGDAGATIEAASADASARSYWRVHAGNGTAILMDAADSPQVLAPWCEVAARLRAAGLNAPEVLAADRAHGFLLLSDLGSRLYLDELNDGNVDALYGDALAALATLQARVDPAGLPRYDELLLTTELELLPTWFLQRHLGIRVACDDWDIIEVAFRLLIDNATGQPQVCVHRDFHSRNLLVVPAHNPGIIDLQDAVRGPVTYDLASLLRDCYTSWDDARVRAWAEAHRQRLLAMRALDPRVDAAHWQRWFDLTGLQRHLKVLGIFCRLWYRDGKRGYLRDLPRVWQYVLDASARYPELHDFRELLQRLVGDHDLTVPRP